jgi:hypothetical protein
MARLKKMLPQVILSVVIGVLALTLGAASGEPTLELTLRARDMTFYVDGDPRPNPDLVLPAARRVRLTFVNEDVGVDHDLVLAGLGERSGVLPGDGSSEVLAFTTPRQAVVSTYSCSLHLRMMTAGIEVR